MQQFQVPLVVLSFLLVSAELGAQESEPPEPPSGLSFSAAGVAPGLTLFSPLRRTDVMLVDSQGELVHRWETELPPGGGVYLLDNGNLLRSAREPENPRFRGGGIGGRIQEFDWDGNLLWDFVLADDYQTQHHDLAPLPNGNVLALVWEHRYPEDAIDLGRDPKALGEAGLWSTAVLELKPILPAGAQVVWEWHLWDHLIQDFDATKENFGAVAEHPGRLDINFDHRREPALGQAERERLAKEREQMRALGYIGDNDEDGDPDLIGAASSHRDPDWMHMNSVDFNARLDLIVLSSPKANEVFVIDHAISSDMASGQTGGRWNQGGQLLYRWGNPANYGAGERGERQLYFQHDPSWVAGEEGPELLVFNNGGGVNARGFSSVDQLRLPFDEAHGFALEAGAAFAPKRPAWTYSNGKDFYSGFISGAQRLPNGNTLICAGAQGRIFEVAAAGKVVWDYTNPYIGSIKVGQGGMAPGVALFRATRIAPDHPGLRGRDL